MMKFTEGTELNATHWEHEVQNAGWVNNELKNYVDGVVNGKRVTELSDGKLRIHCFKGDDGRNIFRSCIPLPMNRRAGSMDTLKLA